MKIFNKDVQYILKRLSCNKQQFLVPERVRAPVYCRLGGVCLEPHMNFDDLPHNDRGVPTSEARKQAIKERNCETVAPEGDIPLQGIDPFHEAVGPAPQLS